MRGREQQMIDKFGGALSDRRKAGDLQPNRNPISGNAIRSVRKDHPLGAAFHLAASLAFGNIAPYTGK
jgi:hypothetical protein